MSFSSSQSGQDRADQGRFSCLWPLWWQYLYVVNDEVGSLAFVHAPEEGDLYPELVVAAYLVLQLHPRRAEGKTGV